MDADDRGRVLDIPEYAHRIARATERIARILAGAFPIVGVPCGTLTIFFPDAKIEGIDMTATVKAGASGAVKVKWTDAYGNPARVDGETKWDSADSTIATVAANRPDSTSAQVRSVGKLGRVDIFATADADMGQGKQKLTAILSLVVIPGDASGGEIEPAPPASGGDNPVKPDNTLPGKPAYPSHGLPGAGAPDQGLPPGAPGHPANRPPGSADGHPDQGLPGYGRPVYPDNAPPPTPVQPPHPGNRPPGVGAPPTVGGGPATPPGGPSTQPLPPGYVSGQPVPPGHVSGQPIPGAPVTPGQGLPDTPAPKK